VKDSSLREMIQANWKQLSGKVRHEWGKLTHNDVEQIKGDMEVLAGKIEQWVHRVLADKAEHTHSDTPAN
jgi:uncharacterized protein YjbJ (UPF0337 family)